MNCNYNLQIIRVLYYNCVSDYIKSRKRYKKKEAINNYDTIDF